VTAISCRSDRLDSAARFSVVSSTVQPCSLKEVSVRQLCSKPCCHGAALDDAVSSTTALSKWRLRSWLHGSDSSRNTGGDICGSRSRLVTAAPCLWSQFIRLLNLAMRSVRSWIELQAATAADLNLVLTLAQLHNSCFWSTCCSICTRTSWGRDDNCRSSNRSSKQTSAQGWRSGHTATTSSKFCPYRGLIDRM